MNPKCAVKSYYLLNDIILAWVVGDENIGDEVNQLTVSLENLSKETGILMNVEGVVNSLNRLFADHGKVSHAEETRAIFKKQLKLPALN